MTFRPNARPRRHKPPLETHRRAPSPCKRISGFLIRQVMITCVLTVSPSPLTRAGTAHARPCALHPKKAALSVVLAQHIAREGHKTCLGEF